MHTMLFLILPTLVAAATDCTSINAELHRKHPWVTGGSTTPLEDSAASGHKHEPRITIVGSEASVQVGGTVKHPMVPSANPDVVHWISHIVVVDQDENVVAVKILAPSEPSPATFNFTIPADKGITALTPYEYCNKHGLYKGPEVAVNGSTGAWSEESCTPVESNISNDYESIRAELYRDFTNPFGLFRAEKDANGLPVFYQDSSTKHSPYITVDGGVVTVVVGDDPKHPMVGSNDSNAVHWITTIWLEDAADRSIVAMEQLLPNDGVPATLATPLPANAETMCKTFNAFEMCNKHGIYIGPIPMTFGTCPTTTVVEETEETEADSSSRLPVFSAFTVVVAFVVVHLAA